jgi:O-antigen/teichoic acid export membrane protein
LILIDDGQSGELNERVSSNRKLAFGAIASGTVNIVKVALQLLLLPVMARLLGPDEFGVYALALPTVSFVALLADGGLGATLAREPESSSRVWSSAFWFLLFTGCVLALGASVFGIFLSHIVQQPRVSAMIALLSLSLVFLVLSVPAAARLTRRRNLGVGAAAELTANLVGAVVAVILAMSGAGAWSLVAQYLATYAVRTVVLNIGAFEMPRFEFSMSSIRPHMASGGLLIGARLSDYIGRVGENVLIDRTFGTALLGSFTFANQISRFATETAGNVSWAALYVQALTADRASVVDIHRRLCRMLAGILFPATFLAAAAAPELIDALLGPKWSGLALLLRVMLPIAAFQVIAAQVGAILLAIDRFEISFWCTIGLGVGRIAAVCAGPWIGLAGVAGGIAAATLLHSAALVAWSEPLTGCRVSPMLRGLVGPAVSSLVAVGACLAMLRLLSPSLASTLVCLAAALAVYTACMFLIDRKGLTDDWNIARRLMKGPGSATPAQAASSS